MLEEEKEQEKKIQEKIAQMRMGEPDSEKVAQEEAVREKVDEEGNRWKKVYFGGGEHFRNWLSQYEELGFEIEVEEIDSRGFRCFEEGGEKMYRIWVKQEGKPE